ncbi:hypothetical protein KGF57_000136 [Candida theae]|uniref:Uncharacterized protein n=1 Tax=Candida theae TaxID=1198502 RepID=A0AAD5BJF9_9ASCO|nr:uncharacterized protein KGF57_000136 [Candida theae]KAI5968442.1 hypothetical protein KGF57_000136 [Candida theae]
MYAAILLYFCYAVAAFELQPPMEHLPDPNDAFPTITDLDQESSHQNLSGITYHTISNQSQVTPVYLKSLLSQNFKTIVYITNTNTTIIPIDEVLMHNDPSKLSSLTYLEIKHHFRKRVRYNYIPVSPCISSHTFRLDPPLMGIAWTHRVSLSLRYTTTFGGSITGSTGSPYFFNTTTFGLTLGEKLRLKYGKERSWDSFVACYSTESAARLFGYVPLQTVDSELRVIHFNWRTGDMVWGQQWFRHPPRVVIDKSQGVRMVCDVSSREKLKCGSTRGSTRDRFGNELIWDNVY